MNNDTDNNDDDVSRIENFSFINETLKRITIWLKSIGHGFNHISLNKQKEISYQQGKCNFSYLECRHIE